MLPLGVDVTASWVPSPLHLTLRWLSMRGSSFEALWPLPHSRSFLARGYFLNWVIPGLFATSTLLPLLPSPPFSFFLSRRYFRLSICGHSISSILVKAEEKDGS